MASQFPGGSPITPPPPYAPPPAGGGIVGRVQRIITQPTAEWQRIAAEPTAAQGVFTRYAVPLAAIGPIAGLIGMQVFGISAFGINMHPPLVSSLIGAVMQYLGALAFVWVLALIVDLLAPNFGSAKDLNQSMKVAAYSLTAYWLAGIFSIFPLLSFLGLIGLAYSLYLFWVGLPINKRPPAAQAVGYTVVSIIVAIVGYILVTVIVSRITFSLVAALVGAVAAPGATVITTGS